MTRSYTDFPPDSLEYIYGFIWDYVKLEDEKSLTRARNLFHVLGLGFRFAGLKDLEAETVFLADLLYRQRTVYLNYDPYLSDEEVMKSPFYYAKEEDSSQ